MDAYEATRVVFSRIKILDPENAAKIMGLLLIQDHGEKEMIRLAFGPETLLHSVVLNARKELGLHLAAPPPPPLTVSSPSWAPSLSPFSRSSPAVEDLSPNSSPSFSPFYGGDLVDDLVNDGWGINANGHLNHRRSSSISEMYLGWRPCHYYARGYCKNGSSCRFVHGFPDDGDVAAAAAAVEQQCHELLLRSKSQRIMSFSPPSPLSSSAKSMIYLLQQQQQQQSDTQWAAAAAAMMMAGDDAHKFLGRSRAERCDFSSLVNPGSRQIYLTFPADSTFREEDVSNYFSIYGPVQDVRIPYQQKRMFGFVTFVFPETVKLILAKGNPHFVCDSRVLVKPYKEKGKIPDKKQQLQGERGDFSGCSSPTGLDLRDHYDLQQLRSRMLYGGNHDVLMRRKLEEQQKQAELQQAFELQNRRFMGLHLLDLKPRGFSSFPSGNSTVGSPVMGINVPNGSEHESPPDDKSLSPASGAASALSLSATAAVNAGAGKDESAAGEARNPMSDGDFQESCLDHNLPDSPFASPTKAASFSAESFSMATAAESAAFSYGGGSAVSGDQLVAPSLLPAFSNMGSFKSCLFQLPRFSSGHGAVGM